MLAKSWWHRLRLSVNKVCANRNQYTNDTSTKYAEVCQDTAAAGEQAFSLAPTSFHQVSSIRSTYKMLHTTLTITTLTVHIDAHGLLALP